MYIGAAYAYIVLDLLCIIYPTEHINLSASLQYANGVPLLNNTVGVLPIESLTVVS